MKTSPPNIQRANYYWQLTKMNNLETLKQQRFEAETNTGRISTRIASCKDSNERLRLMRELKAAYKVLNEICDQIATIERTERLKDQQAARDNAAQAQNNACGRTRNRQRDI
jgi:hypothetical protein